MSDLISRQAAIDAMCDACSDWCDEGVCKKVSAIQQLPSAEPDKDINVHNTDCELCKYFDDNRCIFYSMGSGNVKDMPCWEK